MDPKHKNQKKKENVWKLVSNNALAFSRSTSLHGLAYLEEPGRSYTERLFWSITFLCSIFLCIYLISPVYNMWLTSPTITTIEDLNYPISKINFPAVTICSNSRYSLNSLEKIVVSKPWSSMNKTIPYWKNALNRFVYTEKRRNFQAMPDEMIKFINENTNEIHTLILKMIQPCGNLVVGCLWQGIQIEDCGKMFQVSRTDIGYCCSFNALSQDQLLKNFDTLNKSVIYGENRDFSSYVDPNYRSYGLPNVIRYGQSVVDYYQYFGNTNYDYRDAEDKYGNDNNENIPESSPIRSTSVAGSLYGLTVLVNNMVVDYQLGLGTSEYIGTKILVHAADAFPEVYAKGLAVGIYDVAFIGVTAEYTQSTDAVKRMSFNRRKCLLPSDDLSNLGFEVKLEAFKNYSQAACQLECKARAIMADCNCLPYYFLNFSKIWNKNTNCNISGLQCIEKNIAKHNSLMAFDSEAEAVQSNLNNSCICPTDCDRVVYKPQVSYGNKPFKGYKVVQEDDFYKYLVGKGGYLRPYVQRRNDLILLNTTESLKEAANYTTKIKYLTDRIIKTASLVHIYFKEPGISKYSTDELYSIVDLIAAFGGTAGLCMGFSLLTLVEIFYFFPLRFISDLRRKFDQQKIDSKSIKKSTPEQKNV